MSQHLPVVPKSTLAHANPRSPIWRVGEIEPGLVSLTVLVLLGLVFVPAVQTALGVLSGALTAIWVGIARDRLTEPRLRIVAAERLNPDEDHLDHWGLRISQVEKDGDLLVRQAAAKTRVYLSVLDPASRVPLFPEVAARWTGGPRFFDYVPDPTDPNSPIRALPSPAIAAFGESFTVYAGHHETVDVLLKYAGDPNAYLFSNASYTVQPPGESPFRKPEWRIPPGHWLLMARVHWGPESYVGVFDIQNRGTALSDLEIRLRPT